MSLVAFASIPRINTPRVSGTRYFFPSIPYVYPIASYNFGYVVVAYDNQSHAIHPAGISAPAYGTIGPIGTSVGMTGGGGGTAV